MQYLGIDYGEKHIGLAIGSSETKVSVPYKTVERSDDTSLLKHVRAIVQEEGIDTIVVGVPMGGEAFQGQQKKNLAFVQLVMREFPSKIVLTADESFTSLEAKKRMQEAGGKSSDDHAVAAMLILQAYLDARHS